MELDELDKWILFASRVSVVGIGDIPLSLKDGQGYILYISAPSSKTGDLWTGSLCLLCLYHAISNEQLGYNKYKLAGRPSGGMLSFFMIWDPTLWHPAPTYRIDSLDGLCNVLEFESDFDIGGEM